MHGPINVKYPNNISEWQMGFNSAFKGLNVKESFSHHYKKATYLPVNVRSNFLYSQFLSAA